MHYARGYELLRIPVLERQTSFSKEVVGSSPWPEWNPHNCITVDLNDYDRDFHIIGTLPTLLIPEGTVSVARWLSRHVANVGADKALPLKLMYGCPCFRNESIDSLRDGHKLRAFDQFGIEVIGSSSEYADVEIILSIVDS